MYTFDGTYMPTHTLPEAFRISFIAPSDIDECERTIRLENGLIFGNEEASFDVYSRFAIYRFDVYDSVNLSIYNAKPESITIYGSDSIISLTT